MALVSTSTCRARSDRWHKGRRGEPATTGQGDLQRDDCFVTLAGAAGETQKRRWKKRILLVDDNEQVITSVAQVLVSQGYSVMLAADGCEAISQCQRCHPDLIIIDLNIPLTDGGAALESIEQLCPLLPMIVITARPLQHDRTIAFGVDALMEKPLDLPTLLAEIEKLLKEPVHKRLKRLTGQNFATVKLDSAGAND